jgi:hypothetical protein
MDLLEYAAEDPVALVAGRVVETFRRAFESSGRSLPNRNAEA